MFISVFFKAHVSKGSLAAFFANVPAEQYCFIVPESGEHIYGCFVSVDDLLEYFTNEFPIQELQMLTTAEFKKACSLAPYKVWGSRELLLSL